MKEILGTMIISIVLMFALFRNASAEDYLSRRITVVNNTTIPITQLFGSNVGASTWENDILGSKVIMPHTTAVINFDDGTGSCLFDIKAVMFTGQSTVKANVDVCRTTTLTITFK